MDTSDDATLGMGRLVLRRFTTDDVQALPSLLNDLEVTASVAQIPYPYGVDEAKSWISYCEESDRRVPRTSLNRAIALASDGRLLGAISLMGIDRRAGSCEIGYWLGRAHWGNGFASEAAAAMVDFAFGSLEVEAVQLNAFEFNLASCRIAEKLGFRFLGRSERPRRCRATGREHFEKRYCVTRDRFGDRLARR